MTATMASRGPSGGSATSSTCSDLRGSLSHDATPRNICCSARCMVAARIAGGSGTCAKSAGVAFRDAISSTIVLLSEAMCSSHPAAIGARVPFLPAGDGDVGVDLRARQLEAVRTGHCEDVADLLLVDLPEGGMLALADQS